MKEWDIIEAIELIRAIEREVRLVGLHVGLLGGVITKTGTRKDLDLLVYPDKSPMRVGDMIDTFKKAALKFSIELVERRDHSEYADDKVVYRATQAGRQIDVFFLQ